MTTSSAEYSTEFNELSEDFLRVAITMQSDTATAATTNDISTAMNTWRHVLPEMIRKIFFV